MSDGTGNYSLFHHNLRMPNNQPCSLRQNKLLERRTSSENTLNRLEGLSILSPTTSKVEELSHSSHLRGEPLVPGFIPHPPTSPRSSEGSPRSHSTPLIRFRGKKRSRNDSPGTSGSEEEKHNRKCAFTSKVSPLFSSPRRSSTGSLGSSLGSAGESELLRRRNVKGLELLKGIGSGKELVTSFKSYQQSVKSDSSKRTTTVSKEIGVEPVKVNRDDNEVLKHVELEKKTTKMEPSHSKDCSVVVENRQTMVDDELSSSDESLTNVSDDDDDDNDDSTLSSSSDEELKKLSENIAKELSSNRYPDLTLPSLPTNISIASTSGVYENIDSTVSSVSKSTLTLYESVSGYQNRALISQSNSTTELDRLVEKPSYEHTNDARYSSDTELSKKTESEFSFASQSSLLPRVPARTVRMRNKNFLREEMERYLPDYKVGVFVATWNMHEEKEVPEYLDDFLLPESIDFLQDIYVIGLQESTSFRMEWEISLQETLGPSHVLMYSCSFGVLHLAVFVRRELVWFCSAVSQESIATRPGHMIKTKGGLAVAFSLFGTSFLFINSHLTSDEGKAKDRVNDYNKICKSLSLQAEDKPWVDNSADVTDRFDRVFWLGDFNFRVDMERNKVDKLIAAYQEQENPDYKELLEKDQLTNLMSKDEVFHGFSEPVIKFSPTYKHDLQSDMYDTSSKMRTPSWTDRVLYKSRAENTITVVCYDACTSVKNSDHWPVFGIYEVTLKPCKESVHLTGGQFVRDVYIEANRRRSTAGYKTQHKSEVCVIL